MTRACAALVCVTATLAGCGGGSSTGSGGSGATFAARANHMCADFNTAITALPPPRSRPQILLLVRRQLAAHKRELAGLRTLTSPTAQRRAYGTYLRDLAAEDRITAAVVAGRAAPASLEQGTRLAARIAGEARKLRLTRCAESPFGVTVRSRSTAVNPRRPPPAHDIVAALAPRPGGGLETGTLAGGVVRVLAVHAHGRVHATRTITRLAVSTGGQRGLVGLAIDRRGRTFAAFTAPDRHLVVEQIAPGPRRLVWRGPATNALANGGHIAFAPDGRLVIGIGDLQDPTAAADPQATAGKLLSLSPAGSPTQTPATLSSGWNNPYAFTFAPDGRLWVADNAPSRKPERIAEANAPTKRPARVTDLGGKTAPSGLAALGNDRLAVCGVVSGRLDLYTLAPNGRWQRTRTLARGCRYGVVALADRRLAYSTATGIRVIMPPG